MHLNPDQIISDARDAAVNFNAELPNFLVQQLTTRYQSSSLPVNWRAIDTVTADVACVDGNTYRNVAINGRPTSLPVDAPAPGLPASSRLLCRTSCLPPLPRSL